MDDLWAVKSEKSNIGEGMIPMSQNRSKISFLNAVTAMAMTLVNGLLGIVVTRLVIESFGSDFNGVNSTANQIVNVLLILEGGFTMASNVALFSPLTRRDYELVNGVLSATRKKFRQIGVFFLAVSIGVSVAYGFAVNSALPSEFVTTVILMAILPAAFNLFYATTYRVLLQTQQKEYVINIITIITLVLGHLSNIIMITMDGPMWLVRFNTMVFSLINSLLIVFYVRRTTIFLDMSVQPRADLIKGTRDVMIQKITGVIYNSAPIVFLSISPSGGTLLASVYAVYNNVFTMLKSLLHGIIDAPRLSFGQMLTEKDRDEVWPVFALYEYAAFVAVFVMLTTCCALIMPFIKLYMNGITDANYFDMTISVFMLFITGMEMIHIPSGHLINMAGEFKISKNFQLISCIVLVCGMAIGGSIWGIYGMLSAILMVAVLLAVLEMGFVHTCFFNGKLSELLRMLLPLLVASVFLGIVEIKINLMINGFISFVAYGILFLCVNGLIATALGIIFNRQGFTSLIKRFMQLIYR